MNRTDRLTGIMLELRSGQRSAAEFARRFEVSRRTILRDIDALSQLGIPVIALPGPNGGFRLPDDYWLPALHFNDEEAVALVVALRHLGGASASPLGDAHRTAEQKLRAAISPQVLASMDDRLRQLTVLPSEHVPDAAIVRLLRQAVEESEWLRIEYKSLRGDSARVILPREIYVAEGRWYTNALDGKSGERRIFRLDRMQSARRVPPPPDAGRLVARDGAPGPGYRDPSHPEIVIALTARGCRLAREFADLNCHMPEEPDGGVTMRWRCPPGELSYYAQLLTRLGTEVTVIEPSEVREQIVMMAKALTTHHRQETRS